MKVLSQKSKIASQLSRQWAKFRYEIGLAPPPWHIEELVDTIDHGYHLMAEVRVFQNDSGNDCYLFDLINKQDKFETVALIQCCDITAVVSLLLEAPLLMEKHNKSFAADEYCDD